MSHLMQAKPVPYVLPVILQGALSAPYTLSDFSEKRIWKPFISDVSVAGISPASTGLSITGKNNAAYGQLYYAYVGATTRGRFFPDIATGLLDLTIHVDGYKSAGVIANTRWHRLLAGLFSEYNEAVAGLVGVAYGTNEGGKERANICSGIHDTATNPTQRILMGDNNIIADGSVIMFRIKFSSIISGVGGHPAFQMTYAECDINSGTINYLPAVPYTAAIEMINAINGFRLFIGSYSNVGSATFAARYTSVVVNSGFYIP